MPSRHCADADGPRYVIRLPNTPAAASLARQQFLQFVKHLRLGREFIADIEIAVGEALSNAAEHGHRLHGTIRIEASLTDVGMEIVVSDDGPGFLPSPRAAEHPGAMSPRGYGIFLMRSVVDEVEFRDDGKTVWFLKRL